MDLILRKRYTLFLLVFLSSLTAFAGEVVFSGNVLAIGKRVDVLEDTTGVSTLSDVIKSSKFAQSFDETPNFGLSNSTFWLRFTIKNQTSQDQIFLELAYPRIESCTLYSGDKLQEISWNDVFDKREVKHQNIVFKLSIPPKGSETYYLKIKGSEQLVLPLIIRSEMDFFQFAFTNEIISGIHIGVLFVMMLYNFFVYFSIREKSYLYYVLYILFIGLTQTTITGYTFKFLWPDAPTFNKFSIILFPALAGVFAILFFQNFLHSRQRASVVHHILNVLIAAYAAAILLNLFGIDRVSYRIIDVSGVTASLLALVVSIKLSIENYRPAKFYLVAWVIFLIGIVLFTLRNLNILPYNIFTNYTMQAGTAIEVILLSFALADKINILKKEKEISQAHALEISLENEKIILEQNAYLEKSVNERTSELQIANKELNLALVKLKDAQTQLIDSEKMASLGQLTSGIAHEINNPINFVSSNVRPLRRDIEDVMKVLSAYETMDVAETPDHVKKRLGEINRLKIDLDIDYIKAELETLLNGMEDGAKRTVEIVKGLKVFSRIDEADLNLVNLNEGMDSTLVILNYQMGTEIKLVKSLGSIPSVECYGGKINQVFMNILSNSIYALKKDTKKDFQPTIWVTTWLKDDEHVAISIKDNGIGIPAELKTKIFDPFFTTKQIGEGTGLGLSIVFKIIEVHGGTIIVNSEVGEGTEFVITLPIVKKKRPIPEFNE
ncbi:Adaptive-response sensory-kinase SasA [Dyadobacter sp. CECT 9275]|uniref:histidine kinase n=1 Tax=Dyadobacter helix TaxID=2822344 RepID=A0A916J9C4_9BACT|nr:7TM diverse intracellular signaling domain-containing protein [Dyadobacter sp. CECT 9275]CAG4994567.1 Adaptive-response sensory-kinase SasA [Dyadobacter sp. CECT 9275]